MTLLTYIRISVNNYTIHEVCMEFFLDIIVYDVYTDEFYLQCGVINIGAYIIPDGIKTGIKLRPEHMAQN
jgi:hypothetical protein